MKLRNIKYSKIAVVVFLTALIWVWADLSLDAEHTIPRATITMGSSRSSHWISFRGEPTVDINNIRIKGPVSKIGELKRIISNDPQKLEFTLNAEQQEMLEPGEYPQDVSDFIKNIDWIRALGLTVEDCVPDVVDVNVVELEQKVLDVRCIFQDGIIREPESIVPETVSMFVPKDWFGEKLRAFVDLSPVEIKRARSEAILKIPYIELATGQSRLATGTVKIKMPPEEDLLELSNVENPTLGYAFSITTMGKYEVQVANMQVVTSITIRATPAAKEAYENKLFKVILEIDDGDIKKAAEELEIQRPVIYNFPREFAENGEIKLASDPIEAKFKLVPISPENP